MPEFYKGKGLLLLIPHCSSCPVKFLFRGTKTYLEFKILNKLQSHFFLGLLSSLLKVYFCLIIIGWSSHFRVSMASYWLFLFELVELSNIRLPQSCSVNYLVSNNLTWKNDRQTLNGKNFHSLGQRVLSTTCRVHESLHYFVVTLGL